jgi:NTP pyrophosphatase (non-canonical NTP hydrolase)
MTGSVLRATEYWPPLIEVIDDWLDCHGATTYQDQPLAQDWARVAKVAEETGEAIDRLIAMTGQNPRKGVCGTREELLGELADVALTAILAMQHFTKDSTETFRILDEVLAKIAGRVPQVTS